MRVKTQAPGEYRLREAEASRVRELATEAAALENAETVELADLLLDVPAGLRGALVDFSAGASPQGLVLVRGLPVGEVPATPREHGGRHLAGHGTTGLLMLVADLLGTLIGYEDEKSGSLIHEVHPVPGEERRIENSGAVAFDFHTENVHHPLRPDFLGLLCLRQDHDAVAATRVASVRHAYPLLTPAQREILRMPIFSSAYPTSFSRNIPGPRPASGPHPVIFGEEPDVFMRYNSHTTTAVDPEARAALKALSEALEESCREVVLAPGDLVVVDNHIAAHGRSAFTPRFDGRDRWLRRCYSLRAIPRWAESMMPRPRVLPALTRMSGVL
ncbi:MULTISPECIES: TauD/TfdA family dioxygenase [Streptomyces]|uniref:TauD/TfdA family dioxygenase n=1 Tax=Streptomyces sudanensis TaxID=436397 RepID=A0ABY4TDZ2_9ACTN|nr:MULTISPECIES: TauD/TfdA family dioxygenase [Streptomyces]URN17163.1 TauD/TfdA family dioxygenase [Streptomyces sudanensis]